MAVRQAEENDGEDDQDIEPPPVGMIYGIDGVAYGVACGVVCGVWCVVWCGVW